MPQFSCLWYREKRFSKEVTSKVQTGAHALAPWINSKRKVPLEQACRRLCTAFYQSLPAEEKKEMLEREKLKNGPNDARAMLHPAPQFGKVEYVLILIRK